MDSKTLLRASAIGGAALAYIMILIFRVDIFSVYTLFAVVVGAAIGVAVAYRVKFR